MLKTCRKCSLEKQATEFHKAKGNKDGLASYCKDCVRAVRKRHFQTHKEEYYKRSSEWKRKNRSTLSEKYREWCKKHPTKNLEHRLRKYGLTLEDFNRMAEEQGGVCAICRCVPTLHRLFVDHCHVTGKVRGLLCNSCNSVLGYAKDNTEVLKVAIQYLRKHS